MRLLLLTPPMTQLNTPYPATAYLKGFLRQHAPWVEAFQADPALEVFLRLFSRSGLVRVRAELERARPKISSAQVKHFMREFDRYAQTIEPIIRFLQGKDSSLAMRIVNREFLPEGARFPEATDENFENLRFHFGGLGIQDLAKHLATLYLDDLADVIREGIDPKFEFSRYGEKLAASQPTFDPILRALNGQSTLVDTLLDEWTEETLGRVNPDVLALSVPFPGNVYGAFRIAKKARAINPKIKIILGGGYVNTELRELTDARVFEYVDYITYDDGERPILSLLERLRGREDQSLLRTRLIRDGKVTWESDGQLHDIPHRLVGTPSYEGLHLDQYLSLFEMLNPMHRIWSDGRWNKLTLAHGCYWKKCNFCDVNLDYIGRYDPAHADQICDQMEALIRETGQSGFHFVDEAAPPALLKAMALRILERGITVTWWGNIRFEKAFTPELCELLARSGCIAVSGGLEVASDRLLKLMNKGVTVEQVARVTQSFMQSGILVHAYLMYGFPTQTVQETVDALERVRQLFSESCIQSAFWHRFSVTCHSPIGKNPSKFGIDLLPAPEVTFARNDLAFNDPTGVDHDFLGEGLRRALFNFMQGQGLEEDVRLWFQGEVPRAKVPRNLIREALADRSSHIADSTRPKIKNE